jgi:outer membrane protein TolC
MLNKPLYYLKYGNIAIFLVLFSISGALIAQMPSDTFPVKATLSDCVNYALKNQPLVRQSKLDEDITKQNIRIALSGWLPQVNADANLQHYLKLPVSFFPDLSNPSGPKQEVTTGVLNTSALQFSANQTIYSTDLFFAGRTAHDLRQQALENTQNSKINVVVNVSKAFYDVVLTNQQVQVLTEDIQRLEQNYKDAYNQYKAGLNDKTDYQRALIALNNAKAEQRSVIEASKAKYVFLKQLMGYSSDKPFTISFDSVAVEKEIVIDTLQNLKYDNRIEYQILQTNLKLQQASIRYNTWSFLPTVSAFGNYNLIYQNDQFSQLYNKDFPNSLIGLKLSLPIFQGASRWHSVKKASLQYERMQLDVENFKNQINTEYSTAMASYKGNLNALHAAKENTEMARDIFNIIKYQYDKGIKTYLDVIVAETDLRTAELNYLDALYQVLSSTLDVKKALGNISVN